MVTTMVTMAILPKYPVYVPSAGRWKLCYTARFLTKDRCPFYLVVQPCEAAFYREQFPEATILELPWNNDKSRKDGLLLARNWIREHSIAAGHDRHWQLDDNITYLMRRYKAQRFICEAGPAFRIVEDFVDRYTNVGLAGMNYSMFVADKTVSPPFVVNVHVYSCSLVCNRMPYKWRLNYNDDTDLCLQVLSGGLCTVLFNAVMCMKKRTMTCKGGNTDDLYKINDGRLIMSRTLERVWPGVVTTQRRFERPQHVIKGSWRGFDTQLIRRTDIDWDNLPEVDNYGLSIKHHKEIRSERLKRTLNS